MQRDQLSFFEQAGTAHAQRPLPFSPFGAAKKRRFARPAKLSRIPRSTNIGAAIVGAGLQHLPLTRQGEEIAAVLEAKAKDDTPLYREVVVLIPRRAAKTTSIWSVILGRCATRSGYKVVTTAQDGIRARNRFREVQRALVNADFEGEKDPANRLGRLRWANGDESIEFDNGSRIWVVPPEAGAFRGEAADLILFDEAGELSQQRSEDIVSGALPLMDTRPDGQVIFAGTPGLSRVGLLWDKFQAAIAPKSKIGIVGYFIHDEDVPFTYDTDGSYHLDTKLLRRTHPGIGTLTKLDIIAQRVDSMPPAQFEREYLCRFPFDNATSAISSRLWEAAKSPTGLPPRPDKVGLGFDVAPDSSAAALAAAWRDEDGRAHVEILAANWGTDWLAAAARQAAKKHHTAIGFDSIGANVDTADRLRRLHVQLAPMYIRQMQGAAARFTQLLNEGKLVHYDQADLNAAAHGAAWRSINDSGRLFARKASSADVCPLVAASIAIWQADQTPRSGVRRIITSEDL